MPQNFDLFRKTKSKKEVDVDFKVLEDWGLTWYRMGKCMFGSKAELENLIRTKGIAIKKKPSIDHLNKSITRLEEELAELKRLRGF